MTIIHSVVAARGISPGEPQTVRVNFSFASGEFTFEGADLIGPLGAVANQEELDAWASDWLDSEEGSAAALAAMP